MNTTKEAVRRIIIRTAALVVMIPHDEDTKDDDVPNDPRKEDVRRAPPERAPPKMIFWKIRWPEKILQIDEERDSLGAETERPVQATQKN